ncbi:MAG: mechanosensitive ion channel family protein [Luteolibacter sp.]
MISTLAMTFDEFWNGLVYFFNYQLFELNKTPVNGAGILQLILLLFGAWWLSKIIRGMLRRFGAKQKAVSKTSLYTLERIAHYVILAAGILLGLSSLGLDFSNFAIFASAIGVGLGFGLQNIFSNFVAGLIVLFEKSLNIGDFIELESGLTGEVREINMRSVLITTNDNVDILVPNSEFVTTRVTNWTLREANRRIHVGFGVAYGTDKELVRSAVLESAGRVKGVLVSPEKRRPQVWLTNFGDSSLDFELVAWLTPEAVKRPGSIHAELLWEIETDLTKHGIEIPFPQQDLHIRSAPGLAGARIPDQGED